MARRHLAIVITAVTLGLFTATAADAGQYSVTGVFRSGCCNFPTLGFGLIPINDFPFAGGGGGVTMRLGNAPPTATIAQALPGKTMMFGADVFDLNTTLSNPAVTNPPSFLTAKSVVDWHNAPGTLAPGGGPGNVAYCINYGGNPNCTAASKGVTYNGLLSHTSPGGSPNFGGTMTLLGGIVLDFSRTLGAPSITAMGVGDAAIQSVLGNSFANYYARAQTISIMTPGVTFPSVQNLIDAGLPWGTGVVYGVVTGQAIPGLPTLSFSYAGTDTRDAAGVGNITLVSAHLSAADVPFAFINGIRLILAVPEPATTGMLAAGLGLLGVVEVTRRKRSARS